MSDKQTPTTQGTGVTQFGVWGALFLGLGGAFLVRMGYDLGISQSRRVLKRHDQDIRRMFKRERKIQKQYEKENRIKNRRSWFIK